MNMKIKLDWRHLLPPRSTYAKYVVKFLRKQDSSAQKGLHPQLEGVENIFDLNHKTLL